MRLTLRTLLAYLDKTLAPGESAFLEQKIRQAKVANVLVDRISTVIVAPNLPPLRIDAQGTAGDANTVAEYLDNTLDPNVVVDFEQACLSEDARLAEVAACHQILSSAISDTEILPPEIVKSVKAALNAKIAGRLPKSPNSNENLRRLDSAANEGKLPGTSGNSNLSVASIDSLAKFTEGTRPTSPNASFELSSAQDSDPSLEGIAPSSEFGSQSYKEKPVRGIELSDSSVQHVPDYLRSHSSGRWLNVLSTSALVAALIVLGWLSLGSLDRVQQLFIPPEPIVDNNLNLPADIKSDVGDQEKNVAGSSPKDALSDASLDSTTPSTAVIAPPRTAEAAKEPIAPVTNSSEAEMDLNPLPVVTEPSEEVLVPLLSETNVSEPKAPTTADALARAMDTEETDQPIALSTNENYSSTIVWRPETKGASQAIVLSSKPSTEIDNQLHLVESGEGMLPLDNWIVPTANRTECWLEPGIRLKIADFTDMSMGRSIAADTAVVRLRIGRALVAATPNCKSLILETSDSDISKIDFTESNGVVAIELRYQPLPGLRLAETIDEDGSLSGMMRPVFSITGVVGSATIKRGIDVEEQIAIGETILWNDNFPPERKALESMPWWFKEPSLRPVDLEASRLLRPVLAEFILLNNDSSRSRAKEEVVPPLPSPDEVSPPLEDTVGPTLNKFLQTQTVKRSVAQSALAAQILILNGEYSLLAGTSGLLSDPSIKAHRSILLDTLEQSLGAEPSRELALQDAIQEADPARASTILKLLSAPSDQQLEEGEDRSLVDAIASPFLDERVLGIHQLSRIIGRDLGYQCDRPSSESIQAWKKLLNAKKIRWPKPKVAPQ